jgi:hypothetical protein
MLHSQALRRKIALVSARHSAVSRALWSHHAFAHLYPDLLAVVHAITRASVPLMEAAREVLGGHPQDSLTSALDEYFCRHIVEEVGHDQWVLDDLMILRGDPDPLHSASFASVATLVGAQYFWLRHLHPLTLLGYIAVIEGEPVDIPLVQQAGQQHGVPTDSLRAYVRHGHLDVAHSADFDVLLNTLPLTRRQEGWIAQSAFHSVAWVTTILEELLERHRESPTTIRDEQCS